MPKKPLNKLKESSGELEPLASSKELLKIIKILEAYLKQLEKKGVECKAFIKQDTILDTENKRREVFNLYGNESGLIAVALRILNIATFEKGAHYHLDKISGELDDNTEEIVITKTDNKRKN